MTAPLYPLGSVDNALRLIALLSRGAPVRVTDAAAELGVAVSTAHRLLAMLEYRQFARRTARARAYGVGPALLAAAHDLLREPDLAAAAIPSLDVLLARYAETVYVAVAGGSSITFVAGRESPQTLRAGAHVGESFPMHATAAGRVIAAGMTRGAFRALYPAERLAAVQAKTPTSRAAFERGLSRVRADGYAINVEANAPGISAVAVPIRAAAGDLYGALTLVAPTSRFDVATLRGCVPDLQAHARRIGGDMDARARSS